MVTAILGLAYGTDGTSDDASQDGIRSNGTKNLGQMQSNQKRFREMDGVSRELADFLPAYRKRNPLRI
jgi:hypothetical protein